MKLSSKEEKRVGGIGLEMALAVFFLAILLSAGKAPESQASSGTTSSSVATQPRTDRQRQLGPVPGQCIPPPANLVSWWPGDGDATDIQGDNDGTITDKVTFTPGMVGQAFNFAGGGCVSIPDNANLRPANITIDAWVRPASGLDQIQPIFTKDGAGFVGYELRIDYGALFPDGTIVFLLNVDNMVQVLPSTDPIPIDGQFHLIAATYDGATANIYLDGAAVGSMALPGTLTHATDPALIGCGIFRAPAVAEIDEVELFDRALTQAEILSIFVAGSAGKCRPPCVALTCPADVIQPNDPGQCCGVVNYLPPTANGVCGTVTCNPPSGTCFPVGTTTVTCTSTAGPGCTFTVTIVDTQPPSITCPANITAVIDQNACPSPACQVVTFSTPIPVDNCPDTTVVCNPPSGSCFPIGVTTVTCTATDAAGLSASCSFTITVFDVVLQDDSNPNTILLWNSQTGAYRFCCNGVTFTGVGKPARQGCVYTLQHNPVDRRVLGRVDKAVHAGTASIQAPPGTARCTITDRSTLNNSNATSCQ